MCDPRALWQRVREVRKVDGERGERAGAYESALEAVLVRLLGRRRRDHVSDFVMRASSEMKTLPVNLQIEFSTVIL